MHQIQLGYQRWLSIVHIGQLGFGFSLILLSKYGHVKRLNYFYGDVYFEAFPILVVEAESQFDTQENYARRCYSLRTFERFLDFFGLVTLKRVGNFTDRRIYITKTDLFDKLIHCKPHNLQFD